MKFFQGVEIYRIAKTKEMVLKEKKHLVCFFFLHQIVNLLKHILPRTQLSRFQSLLRLIQKTGDTMDNLKNKFPVLSFLIQSGA